MTLYRGYPGSLVADALAMPGHWYYNREARRCDYGVLDHYQAPRNPHPDRILWRPEYHALNEQGDILREQAVCWGQRGIGPWVWGESRDGVVIRRDHGATLDPVTSGLRTHPKNGHFEPK